MLMAGCACAAEVGVKGSSFEIDGKKVFLLGCSYYGGVGAPEETWKRDLDQMQKCGMNWIRVWATWGVLGKDVSSVDSAGNLRQENFSNLKRLIEECDRRGMVMDVTLSRGQRLVTFESHRRAVENLLRELKASTNWYLDLANERNVGDARFVSFQELKKLRDLAKGLDEKRLITASHAGDLAREDVQKYLKEVRVDFLSVHRPRTAGTASETQAKVAEVVKWMAEMGTVAPVNLDEPFRRGYGRWQPMAEDFMTDLKGARSGGAAGWCFHNGLEGKGKPARSFDLAERSLFEQLDDEEGKFLKSLR